MFDKFTGKKKKEGDIYSIPEKKYTTDIKAISKMSTKSLIELYHDQDKFITVLCEKLEMAKKQAERLSQKVQQLAQKNEVVNAQILRMTNEHQQLSIKFDNLQCSLEIFSSDNQQLLKKEIAFLKEQDIAIDKLKNIGTVFSLYHEKIVLMKKIQQQNKSIKQRYSELQNQLEDSISKIKELEKQKSYNSLIPSLMQQIQELKSKKEENVQEQQAEQLEQKILQRFKNEFETSSTVKSSQQDEELQSKQAEINKLKHEIKKLTEKNQQMLADNQQFTQSIEQYGNTVTKLERQIILIKEKNKQIESQCSKLHQENNAQKELIEKISSANQQLQKMINEYEKLKKQHNNICQVLKEREISLKNKLEQFAELNETHELTIEDLKSKTQQLERQREAKNSLETMITSNNNSELEKLMEMKNKLEKQCQQLKKLLDSEKKAVIQSQSKYKKISEQNESLNQNIKRMGEEKAIIQQNVNNCLKIAQQEAQNYKKEIESLKKKIEEQKKEIQALNKKNQKQEQDLNNYAFETQKLVKTIQGKDNELRKSYACKEQIEKQKGTLQKIINEKEQDMKIKARKYESELNQERIKLESVNRKLNIFESQSEENKASLQGYYEQLLAKDKKISQMEIRLKDYKYRIQVLRKQKQDLENSYENKLINLQPEQTPHNNLSIRQNTLESKESQEAKDIAIVDQEKDLLRNELFSMKEQNKAILAQNQSLRQQIQTLNGFLQEKQRNIKVLNQKRDNIMKQIDRIRKQKTSQAILTGSLQLPKHPVPASPRNEDRQKKIASKALKGFEIMIKLAHQLYKTFVGIFAQQMQQQQIKVLQKQINAVIKRGNDMRDVFEGYLQ